MDHLLRKIAILIMHRYQLKIEYVGTKYLGWQIQKKGKTVQKTIQIVLKKILIRKFNYLDLEEQIQEFMQLNNLLILI